MILDHRIKNILHHFRDSGRLNVLIALMSHANVRNRCYPSMRLIAKETGYALEAVNEAKKWLQEHGAIEIVKYQQRVGDEVKIKSVRQNVYQLTGVINLDGKEHPYLYVSPTEISENETLLGEISPVEMEVVKAVQVVKESKDSKKRRETTFARTAHADQSPLENPIPPALNPDGAQSPSSVEGNEMSSQENIEPMRTAQTAQDKDLTPHSARPPSLKPERKRSAKQLERDEAMEALAAAMGVTLTEADYALYSKLTRELIKSTIPIVEFKTYVQRIRKSANGKWDVTPNSLITNGRPSEYVTARNAYNAQQGAKKTIPVWLGQEVSKNAYNPRLDPAYASSQEKSS